MHICSLKASCYSAFVCLFIRLKKYIRECIESVLNQSYQNFKLILVDDGSPDSSGAICEEFACTDRRIKVIHKKNMGLLAVRDDAINYVQISAL